MDQARNQAVNYRIAAPKIDSLPYKIAQGAGAYQENIAEPWTNSLYENILTQGAGNMVKTKEPLKQLEGAARFGLGAAQIYGFMHPATMASYAKTMLPFGAATGAIGAAWNGENPIEGAKQGVIGATRDLPGFAGVGQFSNPLQDKIAGAIGAKFDSQVAARLAKVITGGLTSIPEGWAMNTANLKDYTKWDALTDFILGGAVQGVGHAVTAKEREEVKNILQNEQGFIGAKSKVYHGTGTAFDQFDDTTRGGVTGAKSAMGATWFTDDPTTAKGYAVYSAENGDINNLQRQIDSAMKTAQKSGDWGDYDKLVVKQEALANSDEMFKRRSNANVKEATVNGDLYEVDAKGKTPQELSKDGSIDSWLNQQLDKARQLGKDGVWFKNLDDGAGQYNRPSNHYAIFDNKNECTRSFCQRCRSTC